MNYVLLVSKVQVIEDLASKLIKRLNRETTDNSTNEKARFLSDRQDFLKI
jgi:hypothetical protein